MPHPAADRGSATITLATAAALLLPAPRGSSRRGRGHRRAGSRRLHRPARRQQHRRLHPANYLADFQSRGNRVRTPVDRPGRHRRSRKRPTGKTTGPPAPAPSARCSSSPPPGSSYGDGGQHHEPRRRHPRRRPPADRQRRAPATSSRRSSPTTTRSPTSPTCSTGPPATPPEAPRPSPPPAAPLCQQAALGPLPAGTAGKILAFAEAQAGKPYLYGATGPDAYDCSGLAMMAYPRRRDRHPPHQPGSVGTGAGRSPSARSSPATSSSSPGRRDRGRSRARRHRPRPRQAHHDQRVHRCLPRRRGHLWVPRFQGRAVARGGLHRPPA